MSNPQIGLWRNDPKLREGKYPVVLRRDGTIPEWSWFVLGELDPAAPAALLAYAATARSLGMAELYCADVERLSLAFSAAQAFAKVNDGLGDPDQGPHRHDDPLTLELGRGETTMAEIVKDLGRFKTALAARDAKVAAARVCAHARGEVLRELAQHLHQELPPPRWAEWRADWLTAVKLAIAVPDGSAP